MAWIIDDPAIVNFIVMAALLFISENIQSSRKIQTRFHRIKNTYFLYLVLLAKMSKSSRSFKLPPASSSSVSSISGSESGHGLENMLHITMVRTSKAQNAELFLYGDGTKKSNSDLQKKVSAPDPEKEVPMEPPFVALVSNLPMECTEGELQKVFTSFPIRSLTIPKKGKRPKGFAYVEMDSREDLIRLLKMDKLKCRGRCLMTKVSQLPPEPPRKEAGDGYFTRRSCSQFDINSSHYSASVSDLSTIDSPISADKSPFLPESESSLFGRENPIKRIPSSTEEVESRMELRLQKLAEFENAESEKVESECQDDQDSFMSWSDVLDEIRKSEEM
ncbi:uncharacterized protein LOC6544179 [Drosophila erecta]|uniref:RRM domain-containing protein n=1 Tax=Drosophila erecta TaxID=7220 RepID=B3NGU5_DROER|nr:uncharacterized protein LOC6544179 [Drosophila erecta]EDV51402.2 uncharacterized protein Dere_GG15497 [Drosophila erecta]